MKEREEIANHLLNIAEHIAERYLDEKIAIESLSDDLLPTIANAGVSANVQDICESWAYDYVEVLKGDKSELDSNARAYMKELLSLPLEKHVSL